ncbi:serine/threonine protein kinase [Salidesulfovibrio onnuriiensis]|uniref:serine/threonine protein kinase n=1 Tax=Salidesulfovibrio onnuriiensis TaxID=2583823 RepID=UPI0011CC371A|nr:serine/threonine protein kinase [Salidesulfovibrio onnuriiensis]
MEQDIRELVQHHLPTFPLRRIRRLVTDTTDFTSITYGDVIRLGERHYMVLRDEAERRFGLEDFKFWVKRCKCLETGASAILKLVFHEEFTQQIGSMSIRSFRSQNKEARILNLVRGDIRFMQGIAERDEAGNLIRILDVIRGKRFDVVVDELPGDHRQYFDTQLVPMLEKFITGAEAIDFLHRNYEQHGDVRRDHLWQEAGTGQMRWIDFDYAYETRANPFALDLFGLGNSLLFTVGKQIYTPQAITHMEGGQNVKRSDFSPVIRNRLVNLRRLFPYIPMELNNVLMHFSQGAEVYYDSVEEFLTDLRPCLKLLPQPQAERRQS